jgi:hypothetical protein
LRSPKLRLDEGEKIGFNVVVLGYGGGSFDRRLIIGLQT